MKLENIPVYWIDCSDESVDYYPLKRFEPKNPKSVTIQGDEWYFVGEDSTYDIESYDSKPITRYSDPNTREKRKHPIKTEDKKKCYQIRFDDSSRRIEGLYIQLTPIQSLKYKWITTHPFKDLWCKIKDFFNKNYLTNILAWIGGILSIILSLKEIFS